MQRVFKLMIFFLITCSFWQTAPAFAALPPIYTTDQLVPGMHGVARTVIKGNKIVDFGVEIIGVADNGKGAPKQILARAYGPIVDDTNGVIHGMSGSPVYVDGHLIGAVARGVGRDTTPYIFYITPIEPMIELWELPDPLADMPRPKGIEIGKPNDEKAKKKQEEDIDERIKKIKQDYEDTLPPDEKIAQEVPSVRRMKKPQKIEKMPTVNQDEQSVPAVFKNRMDSAAAPALSYASPVPILASGFDAASLSFLKKNLAPLGFSPYGAAAGGAIDDGICLLGNTGLQPGSSVGVALTYGDFYLGAVGTVTAIDGDKVVAFGHPFTYRGNVNYFMTKADVIGSVKGLLNGEKVASFGPIIGRINQDRYTGVTGIIGQFPQTVPMKITVDDENKNVSDIYGVNIAYDEEMLPKLAVSLGYGALSRTIDRLGSGTATASFTIMSNAVPSGKIERTNMFYDNGDVGQFAVSELGQVLSLITSDMKRQCNVTGIKLHLDYTPQRRTASIISVFPDKRTLKPGQTVNLKIVLRPYRKPDQQILIPFVIPQNQPEGDMTLEVRGGGLIPLSQLASSMPGVDMSPEEDKSVTTADKIHDFLQTDKNNVIIVSPAASAVESDRQQRQAIDDALKLQDELEKEGKMGKRHLQEVKSVTDYVIDNIMRVHLKIKK